MSVSYQYIVPPPYNDKPFVSYTSIQWYTIAIITIIAFFIAFSLIFIIKPLPYKISNISSSSNRIKPIKKKNKYIIPIVIVILILGIITLITIIIIYAIPINSIRQSASCIPILNYIDNVQDLNWKIDSENTISVIGNIPSECVQYPIRYEWKLSPSINDMASQINGIPGYQISQETSNSLFFPPFTLKPAQNYILSVTGRQNGNTQSDSNEIIFNITTVYSNLIPNIVGFDPNNIIPINLQDDGITFILDARNSVDPNLLPGLDEPYIIDPNLTYANGYTFTWSATITDGITTQPLILSNGKPFGAPSGSLIVLDSTYGQLIYNGLVTFTLTFSTGDNSLSSITYAKVNVIGNGNGTTISGKPTLNLNEPSVILSTQFLDGTDTQGFINPYDVINLICIIRPNFDNMNNGSYWQIQVSLDNVPSWLTNPNDLNLTYSSTTNLITQPFKIPIADTNDPYNGKPFPITATYASYAESIGSTITNVDYDLFTNTLPSPFVIQNLEAGIISNKCNNTNTNAYWCSGVSYTFTVTVSGNPPNSSLSNSSYGSVTRKITFTCRDAPIYKTGIPLSINLDVDVDTQEYVFGNSQGSFITPFILTPVIPITNINYNDYILIQPYSIKNMLIAGNSSSLLSCQSNSDNVRWQIIRNNNNNNDLDNQSSFYLYQPETSLYIGIQLKGYVPFCIYSNSPLPLYFISTSSTNPVPSSRYPIVSDSSYYISSTPDIGSAIYTRIVEQKTTVNYITDITQWQSDNLPLTFHLLYYRYAYNLAQNLPAYQFVCLLSDTQGTCSSSSSSSSVCKYTSSCNDNNYSGIISTSNMPSGNPANIIPYNVIWGMRVQDSVGSYTIVESSIKIFPRLTSIT